MSEILILYSKYERIQRKSIETLLNNDESESDEDEN